MNMVIWNYLALRDYQQNNDFLLTKWSKKEAQTFINDVNSVILSLKQGNIEFKNWTSED